MGTEESKLRTLNAISSSLKDLVRIMEALNTNLVTFAKQARETPEITTVDPMRNYVAQPEGYAAGIDWTGSPQQKEGE
jgi:hypothetical protein